MRRGLELITIDNELQDLVREILYLTKENTIDSNFLEKEVTNVLKSLGMPMYVLGFQYMRKAIVWYLQDSDVLRSVTKVLYPSLAEEFDTKPVRVETAMRHAICSIFENNYSKKVEEIFNYLMPNQKPCNSEFIAVVSEYIRTEKL